MPAQDAWVAGLTSLAVLAGVLLSRVALLPNGPWEQDEALLACGVVAFDPIHHMPIPPGFPLWVFIGRAVRLFGIHNPLVALQLASAAFSVLGLWALVGLFEELVGPVIARAGAVVAGFVPGVWYHAPRAFSETPSAALTVIGLACWMRGGRAGFLPGVGLLTAAVLVRPPLAPFLAVAVLLASWGVRDEPARLARGALLSLLIVVVVVLPAALEAGGVGAMFRATSAHADEHFSLLGLEGWSWEGSGYARGLGSSWVAAAFLALAATGWLALRRRLGWKWWAGSIAAVTLVETLLLIHNHTYPRYFVVLWMLMATPAVAGIRALVRREALAALLATAATAAGAWWVYPAMRAIHEQALPAVELLRRAAAEGQGQKPVLIIEDELFSFRNLADRQGWLGMPSMRMEEVGHPRLNVSGRPIFLLTETLSPSVESVDSEVSERAVASKVVERLSQQRFLHASLVRDPVLVWEGAGNPEWEEGHHYFWFGRTGTILIPPVAARGQVSLGLEVLQSLGDVVMTARAAGVATYHQLLHPGKQVLTVPIPRAGETSRLDQMWPLELDVQRDAIVAGDTRPLSFRLFNVSVEAAPNEPVSYEFYPDANVMPMTAVRGEGFYGIEQLGAPSRPAAWTGPRATIDMPVGHGEVGLELMAPRRGKAVVEVGFGPSNARIEVGPPVVWLVLPVPELLAAAGRGTLEITSSTYRPGPQDPRDIGVVVRRVWFRPARL